MTKKYIVLFWIIAPCNLVGGYEGFQGACLPETSGYMENMEAVYSFKTLVTSFLTRGPHNTEERNINFQLH